MLSHDEQPAMVTASAVAAQILVMDAIFMMGLLFLFPEKRWILLVASARASLLGWSLQDRKIFACAL